MKTNENGEMAPHMASMGVPSEESQAANEFAALIRRYADRIRVGSDADPYEIRPCARVRGYILRVPVTKWSFWYPTAAAALDFARQLTDVYRADCLVFDESGHTLASDSPAIRSSVLN